MPVSWIFHSHYWRRCVWYFMELQPVYCGEMNCTTAASCLMKINHKWFDLGAKLNYMEEHQSWVFVRLQVLEPRSFRFKSANKFLVSIQNWIMMQTRKDWGGNGPVEYLWQRCSVEYFAWHYVNPHLENIIRNVTSVFTLDFAILTSTKKNKLFYIKMLPQTSWAF